MDTPLPPARALAIVARALDKRPAGQRPAGQPETDVFAAGVMLLALVTGERKEIRFAPMCVRSLIARALAQDFACPAEMRRAIVALRRPRPRIAVGATCAVLAAMAVLVPLAVSYWDCLSR
ncbi:MAG: hypothetical protein ABI678_17050 [Kofleriaceae bacterium]